MSAGEVWSINPTFDPTGEFPGGVDQTNLDAACAAIANATVPASIRTIMSSSAQRTGARLEVRNDADDSLIGISTQGSTTASAGTGALNLPYQSALVFSLRTNTPGASGRGRVYWPCLSATLNSSGKITAPTTTALLADFKTYMTSIRTALATNFATIGFDLAVRSKTTHSTPHVVRIQLGDTIDTQRRRRDAIVENYVETAFP
jgi:hypothetical protein